MRITRASFRAFPFASTFAVMDAPQTRILWVHVPVGKMVQVQIQCDDCLLWLPQHLVRSYPQSFPGWGVLDVVLYHKAVGRVNLRSKVGDLPPGDAENGRSL